MPEMWPLSDGCRSAFLHQERNVIKSKELYLTHTAHALHKARCCSAADVLKGTQQNIVNERKISLMFCLDFERLLLAQKHTCTEYEIFS